MAENHAIANAKAFAEYISTMYRAYKALETGAETVDVANETFTDFDEIRERVTERALSVEVRLDWHAPAQPDSRREYRILLTTGAPYLQIAGRLSSWYEPETAKIQWRDWELHWSDYKPDGLTNLNTALFWFLSLFEFGA
ncbi:hypothetical protein TPMD04_69 [Thiohalocapsa phage LS06-2018-MD04]|jgi:hypothetical protein|nr:hypothetical protein TPMD04_69 [Thiohalocapsa phage LS06-2018-MD04]